MAKLPISISKICADLEKPAPQSAELLKDKNKDLQKTKLCVYFLQGHCAGGTKCRFAHSASEVRSTPNLTKTQLCVKFMNGRCTLANCTYAHGEAELVKPPSFKKKMCAWYKDGGCRNGDRCGFAHNRSELGEDGTGGGPGSAATSEKPWGKKAVSDDGGASTAVPSSESLVESDISMTGRTGLPDENLFRMVAGRGSGPLQTQVSAMGSAVDELQAKLAHVEAKDQATLQAQVKHMQQTIQHLSKQCEDMGARVHNTTPQPASNLRPSFLPGPDSTIKVPPATTVPHPKLKPVPQRRSRYEDDTNMGSPSTEKNMCHTSVSKPPAKTKEQWYNHYGVRAAMAVLTLALMAMVELTLNKSLGQ